MHICVWEGKKECFFFFSHHEPHDAMKSLQNGILATVVKGNQHSLQAAHRASGREKARHTESDSVFQSWPRLNYLSPRLPGIRTNTIFKLQNRSSAVRCHKKPSPVRGALFTLCLQAQTLSETWPSSVFLTHTVYSHTCPQHGQTLSVASPHCPLLLTFRNTCRHLPQFK